MSFLAERNPFSDDLALRNITTRVTAEDTINVEDAKAIGTTIVNEMVGKCVVEHSFKKKNQIVIMASNNLVNIDPQVHFQRLVTAGMNNEQPSV